MGKSSLTPLLVLSWAPSNPKGKPDSVGQLSLERHRVVLAFEVSDKSKCCEDGLSVMASEKSDGGAQRIGEEEEAHAARSPVISTSEPVFIGLDSSGDQG